LLLLTLYCQGNKIAKRPYKQGAYTKQEIALLKEQYPAISAVSLAAKLKRSLVSVQKQLRKMGVSKRKKSRWTLRQRKLLRRIYKTTPIWQLANQLNKTPSEIKRKAAELGLKK
jgi:hypothetical protein